MEKQKTNNEVTAYIEKLQPWQVEVCNSLREMIGVTVPGAKEQFQYGAPHYLKNRAFSCMFRASKAKISFMIFNAEEIEPIKGVLRSMGNGERKTADIREGQEVDYDLLSKILKETSDKL